MDVKLHVKTYIWMSRPALLGRLNELLWLNTRMCFNAQLSFTVTNASDIIDDL